MCCLQCRRMTVFNYSGFITFINVLKLSIMKKIFKLFATLNFLVLICLSQPVKAQLSDAERQERCQNNKNRIAELEQQLQVLNAELSQTMTKKEMEDARTNMLFVKSSKMGVSNLSSKEELKKILTIGAQYNYDYYTFDYSKGDGGHIARMSELEKLIAKKIDKAMSLNRPALLTKKTETDKQLASHRNNLIALRCDQPSDISGSWTSNIDVSYSISQTQSAFTWEAPKLHSKGEGTVTGNSISATWTGDWGSGSATGTIKLDATGRATQIDWSNGVVFTRN